MKILLIVLSAAVLFSGCVGTPAASTTAVASTDFSVIPGNEWKLTEVRINGRSTDFNRSALTQSGFGESFTLNVSAELINGVGAPNRYTAPYTVGEDNSINIGRVASTLMAALLEPPNLREHDYFTYIQNSYKWDIRNNNLELFSKAENGNEIILIFSL